MSMYTIYVIISMSLYAVYVIISMSMSLITD